MANKNIPDLTASEANFALADLFEIYRNAVSANRKLTGTQLKGFLDTLYPPATGLLTGATYNRYYGIGMQRELAPGTGAIAANVMRAAPYALTKSLTFDSLQAEVTTLVGASNFRLGIWLDDGSLYPGALLVDSGELSGASNGVVAATISQAISPGVIWLGILGDAAITFRAPGSASTPSDIMGEPAAMGSTIRQAFYTVAQTYGALPDPFTAGATINAAANLMPKILIHAA
jgi:hypothetical protein